MNRFSGTIRWVRIGVLAAIATACAPERDPASETPVNPAPGLYEVTLSGAGILKAAGEGETHTYCLRMRERSSFPHLLVRNYYQLHASCAPKRGPREGNAIAGEISCLADPKMAQGFNRFVYNGAIAPENTSIEVRIKFDAVPKEESMTEAEAMQLKLGMKMIERARFLIEAERVGDCA